MGHGFRHSLGVHVPWQAPLCAGPRETLEGARGRPHSAGSSGAFPWNGFGITLTLGAARAPGQMQLPSIRYAQPEPSRGGIGDLGQRGEVKPAIVERPVDASMPTLRTLKFRAQPSTGQPT